MPLVKQTSAAPTRKLQFGGGTALALVLLSWVDDKYLGNQMPETVEASVIALGAIVVGYFVKNHSTDAPPAPGVE